VLGFVQNFGANDGLYGRLDMIANTPPVVLNDPRKGNLAGVGLFMEGIAHNPIAYDLAAEMMWRREAPDLESWVEAYVTRRYGKSVPAAQEAWRSLLYSAYTNFHYQEGATNSVIAARPAMREISARRFGTTVTAHDPKAIVHAWELLLSCEKELGGQDTYQYDLVDVSRQVLAELAQPVYLEMCEAWRAKDADRVERVGGQLVELIEDFDKLLGTRREFLLGPWLEAAQGWGHMPVEQSLLEWNARTQVTLWGSATRSTPGASLNSAHQLRDYAHRHWNGLAGTFYAERWRQYVEFLAARCREEAKAE